MADMSGLPAMITAVGGVTVSMLAIYVQGRKVDRTDIRCQAKLEAMTDQMTDLASNLSTIRKENHELHIKIAGLEAHVLPLAVKRKRKAKD